jgi:hypothetical protein
VWLQAKPHRNVLATVKRILAPCWCNLCQFLIRFIRCSPLSQSARANVSDSWGPVPRRGFLAVFCKLWGPTRPSTCLVHYQFDEVNVRRITVSLHKQFPGLNAGQKVTIWVWRNLLFWLRTALFVRHTTLVAMEIHSDFFSPSGEQTTFYTLKTNSSHMKYSHQISLPLEIENYACAGAFPNLPIQTWAAAAKGNPHGILW